MYSEEDPSQRARAAVGVLLDTNVLLLLLIGRVSEDLVVRCSRLRGYTDKDYQLLVSFLRNARALTTTPHIATEAWNLGTNTIDGKYENQFKQHLADFMVQARETWIRGATLATDGQFSRFGPADTGILRIKRRRPMVVTDDSPLYRQLIHRGCAALNFTHLRSWD